MKRLLAAIVLLGVTGCVSIAKVESGDRSIGDRLALNLTGPWNHVPGSGPAQIWTMEGLPVDQLLLYAGIKDGEAIHATGPGAGKKIFQFRSTMQPDQIAALFEGMLTRDGSSYKLVKLEPASFGGGKGFRFEYSLIRKIDSVQLTGLGYGTVSKGELFAIVYMAPRLAFFSRHAPNVEEIARSVRVKE